ncbi:tetraspanin [Dacryopinax primogenitus]|uniref:Tetraspanin n=1 Tax=Dacryopinax primogenitus (strain DJM 731) TaxID=1858805 RepID=M5G424_DACPD|nr:tetraspanin [Dacryopinax primogenitus]EJT98507.1 tetraspanin [Dacryopinax primogenitus]
MISRKLIVAWSFLLFCLAAAGIVSLVLGIVWKQPNLLINLFISVSDTNAGIAMGVTFLVTSLFAVLAIMQPNASTTLLHVLNWMLVGVGLEVVSIGTFIWYYTLTEKTDFDELWVIQPQDSIVQLQNMFSCCGYFNGTDHAVYQGFCANMQQAMNSTGCFVPLTGAADVMLNDVFSTVYGFMFIVILFFLATACVINKRLEAERFRKIDEKRGGSGFV